MNKSFKSPVVILANGAFPISKIPLDQLKSAGTVICTDGSANNLSKLGLTPHVIIGDMDSIDSKYEFNGLKIHDNNTENSDLEKALNWVIMSNIRLYYPDNIVENSINLLSKEHTHYLVNVMRLKRGSNVSFFNKNGEWKVSTARIVILFSQDRVKAMQLTKACKAHIILQDYLWKMQLKNLN